MYKVVISSSSKKSVDLYSKFLTLVLKKSVIVYYIFNFPTSKNRITLLKSPHVYKKAKEQFECRKYQSVIFISSHLNFKVVKLFLLNKPKSIRIKFFFKHKISLKFYALVEG